MPRPNRFDKVLEALKDQEVAQCRFDYATGPQVDAAALELTAADLRLSAALAEARPLFCPEGLEQVTNRGKGCQE